MREQNSTPLIFSIDRYEYFTARWWKQKDLRSLLQRGALEQETFPDGERLYRFRNHLNGRDVVIVGGMVDERAEMELYDLASGAVDLGARSLTLVIPWMSHSTMERAVRPGEVVTAKNRARFLSSIPRAPLGNRVLLFDLHSEGIPQYFEGGTQTVHVYGEPFIVAAARRLGNESNFVLASTDTGRAKWVESLAKRLEVSSAIALKHRISGSSTETLGIAGEVADSHVILYDDMIRTGGSLLGAARAYLSAGASKVSVIATHGLFPGDTLEKLRDSAILSRIVVSDSHSRSQDLSAFDPSFFEVVPVSHLFLPALRAEVMRVG